MMAFWAIIMGSGLLFYILWGFRFSKLGKKQRTEHVELQVFRGYRQSWICWGAAFLDPMVGVPDSRRKQLCAGEDRNPSSKHRV